MKDNAMKSLEVETMKKPGKTGRMKERKLPNLVSTQSAVIPASFFRASLASASKIGRDTFANMQESKCIRGNDYGHGKWKGAYEIH